MPIAVRHRAGAMMCAPLLAMLATWERAVGMPEAGRDVWHA
ncbi:hypothetical protein [Komagataeibacter swingsii]|nr:hypothetical protein [Komagataeibacter swingsii]